MGLLGFFPSKQNIFIDTFFLNSEMRERISVVAQGDIVI